MNKREAKEIVEERLEELRDLTYERLLELQTPVNQEIDAGEGKSYQLETQALWDDKAKGTLRVMVSIDDGGLRAFAPLSRDFVVAPDGSFVGE